MERLEQIYQALCVYGVQKYVSFDLGMLSKYHYYTGVIMRGYTYGVGEAIVTGGRYDRLLGYFGSDKPAIGFMVVIDYVMEALSRQHIGIPTDNHVDILYYEDTPESFGAAVREAKKRREQGELIELRPKERL